MIKSNETTCGSTEETESDKKEILEIENKICNKPHVKKQKPKCKQKFIHYYI